LIEKIFGSNPKKKKKCLQFSKKSSKTTVLFSRDKKLLQNDCFVLKTKKYPKTTLILGEIFQKKKTIEGWGLASLFNMPLEKGKKTANFGEREREKFSLLGK
jgi:hypothetical protein